MRFKQIMIAISLLWFAPHSPAQQAPTDIFQSAVSFVNGHSKLVVLSAASGASIAVWPAMQGRVLTSAVSPDGRSFGWINETLIASGKVQEHINAVGGEDRLWLGPEGGQFSIFFAPGASFDLAHWYTPAAVDTESFEVLGQSKSSIFLRKDMHVTNYSGTKFDVRIDREVKLLSDSINWQHLGMAAVPGVKMVGYESENKLWNVSSQPMNKATGVLSLWVLGQFQAASAATIILPIHSGTDSQLGVPVKTDYFGQVPPERIHVDSSAVFFKADARYRSKLGVSPRRSKGTIGSYDPEHHVLTIVQYDGAANADYVNSAWEIQKEPYKGDVANCYNDGPPAAGQAQLGHFYELESSSPAVALAPRAFVSHTQRTIHLVGTEQQLDGIAQKVLGVRLRDVLDFNRP